jgi:hypothetical protein
LIASFDLVKAFLLQGRDALLPITNIVVTRRQVPVKRNLATRNSAVYCAQVACDMFIVELR